MLAEDSSDTKQPFVLNMLLLYAAGGAEEHFCQWYGILVNPRSLAIGLEDVRTWARSSQRAPGGSSEALHESCEVSLMFSEK